MSATDIICIETTTEKRFVKGVLSDVFSIEHKIAAH